MTNETEQLSFENTDSQTDNQPVVCLGMTFKNDDDRRKYFREELRKKLPELKNVEGYPDSRDEDILLLSDPPYFTVCPNPWINDFVKEWERGKIEKGINIDAKYQREPFAADVSEGKGDPIYNAHSYHTKVPYKAIAKYILHYTKPGDIILDGFAGTGMTGVAAQKCSDKDLVRSLINENEGYNEQKLDHYVGARKAILSDLSSAASFISSNFNNPNVSLNSIESSARKILVKVEEKDSWMYKTYHVKEGKIQFDNLGNPIEGNILYTVWSDVFICSNCSDEIIFWDCAVNNDEGKINDSFNCPNCNSILEKKKLERAWETIYDESINETISKVKQEPVLIAYKVGNKTFEKRPDNNDIEIIKRINNLEIKGKYPTNRMPEGEESRRNDRMGITHVHHFFTKRNLISLTDIYSECNTNELKFLLTGMLTRSSKQARFLAKNYFHGGGGWVGTSLSGTLFIPSLSIEVNPLYTLSNRLNKYASFNYDKGVVITTQSTVSLNQLEDNSIDYIFTDPPFGGNLMYSELNFIMESWLNVFTNNTSEAVVNSVQRKNLPEYQSIMEKCFQEYFRVLKPGRWITVEFSNSKASVWNSIQDAIQKAGFVIANVAALDKKQGSFKAVTTTTAVKQDLVISAYKPKQEDILKMRQEQNTEESAWTFVKQHLEQLPVFIGIKGEAQIVSERTPRILFDRMVAYHVQNGLQVPISSADFQIGVTNRFPIRDGMAFLDSQVAEYDKKRILVKEFSQMSLFVTDETSAIEWLRQQLMKKPQTRQDIHPNFMKEIQHIAKHEMLPELDDLLNQNFLRYEGDGPVPDQIASYLRKNYKDLRGLDNNDVKLKEKALNRWYVPDPNKQADLEKLREKSLLREFEGYIEELSKSKKKLKQFRTEAIRAGIKKAWGDKDYQKIVTVGDRLPESVIQEDDKLLMYYDNAQIRLGL